MLRTVPGTQEVFFIIYYYYFSYNPGEVNTGYKVPYKSIILIRK